jgi:hypothetical protein
VKNKFFDVQSVTLVNINVHVTKYFMSIIISFSSSLKRKFGISHLNRTCGMDVRKSLLSRVFK